MYSFDACCYNVIRRGLTGEEETNARKKKKGKEKERAVEKERQMSPGYLVGSKEITVTLRRERERERNRREPVENPVPSSALAKRA